MTQELLFINTYKNETDSFYEYLQKHHTDYSVCSHSFFNCRGKKFPTKKDLIITEIICLLKSILIIKKLSNNILYLSGSFYSILLLNRFTKLLSVNKSRIFINNFYIHSLGNHNIVMKILKFLLNSNNITLIVQSPSEIKYYQKLCSSINIVFIPYCNNFHKQKGNEQDYIFSGGYSNRDYSLLIKLATLFPKETFRLALSSLNKISTTIPENVIIERDISSQEFSQRISSSKIVIIPLLEETGSSGQMLCLESLSNGKPIIYSNSSSINYYFDKDCGLPYQIGDIKSLKEQLLMYLSDSELRKAHGKRALQLTELFTCETRNERLYQLILNKSTN